MSSYNNLTLISNSNWFTVKYYRYFSRLLNTYIRFGQKLMDSRELVDDTLDPSSVVY